LFAQALVLPDSPHPALPYHTDLLPAVGFSLEARQTLAAAAQACVFGGMGSWNDLALEQAEMQPRYEQISAALYEAVKSALVMASNTFTA